MSPIEACPSFAVYLFWHRLSTSSSSSRSEMAIVVGAAEIGGNLEVEVRISAHPLTSDFLIQICTISY